MARSPYDDTMPDISKHTNFKPSYAALNTRRQIVIYWRPHLWSPCEGNHEIAYRIQFMTADATTLVGEPIHARFYVHAPWNPRNHMHAYVASEKRLHPQLYDALQQYTYISVFVDPVAVDGDYRRGLQLEVCTTPSSLPRATTHRQVITQRNLPTCGLPDPPPSSSSSSGGSSSSSSGSSSSSSSSSQSSPSPVPVAAIRPASQQGKQSSSPASSSSPSPSSSLSSSSSLSPSSASPSSSPAKFGVSTWVFLGIFVVLTLIIVGGGIVTAVIKMREVESVATAVTKNPIVINRQPASSGWTFRLG